MITGTLDVTADEYHADPCDTPSLSSTIARLILTKSPAHAKAAHPRLTEQVARVEAPHFDLGNAVHSLILEDSTDRIYVVDAPDWRTNAAKAERADAYANGLTPMLAHQWEETQEMVAAVRAQLPDLDVDPPLFTDGKPERAIAWEDRGVQCRALVDWLRDDHRAADDMKTEGRSANPDGWSRTLFNLGYDVQAAFHLRGIRAVTGAEPTWRWLVCETEPPYGLSVMSLSPAALELANRKIDYALEVWRHCLETNTWPGYPTQVCYADLPAWEEARWLEREMRTAA